MEFKNKNILLIFQGANLGGAERQAFGLADFLVTKKNCKVDILYVNSDTPSEEFNEVLQKSHINKTYYRMLKEEIFIIHPLL